MKVLIKEKLSPHKIKTPEGYLICTDAIIARTGKQEYRENEIWPDKDSNKVVMVDRKPEQVFSPETIASFENKPVTCDHPDEDVTPANYNGYSVGFARDIRKATVDGQDVLIANLVITDEDTINDIENGIRTDLSCGYSCDITNNENPEQVNIRGNHIALCQEGRAGCARIVDSINDETKKKAIARYGEPEYVFHHWQVMSNQEAENLAKQKSIENPRDMYYVIYDDIMNPSSDLYWVKGKSYTNYIKALNMRDSVTDSTRKFDAYELRDIYGRYWDEVLEKEFPNLKVHEFAYFGEVKISGPDAELDKLQKRVKYEDSVKDGFKNGDHVEYDGKKATIVRKLTETEKQQRVYAANPNAGDYYEIEVQATKHLKGWKTIVWEKRLKKITDSMKDANHLPTKVKRDLQKFLNHKSTFIKNKDYDISEFVKEFERISRTWVEFPLKIVRESINGWFKTDDGMMRKDYTFSIEGFDDRFMVSIYAKPDTYETTELNAYFTDSMKDAWDPEINKAVITKDFVLAMNKLDEAHIEPSGDDYKTDILIFRNMGDFDTAKNILKEAGINFKTRSGRTGITKIIQILPRTLSDAIDFRTAFERFSSEARERLEASDKKFRTYIDLAAELETIVNKFPENEIAAKKEYANKILEELYNGFNLKTKFTIDSSRNKVGDKLIQSSSKKALQKNIETEIKAGKDPKQAVAIAYSVKRQNDSEDESFDYYRGYAIFENDDGDYQISINGVINPILFTTYDEAVEYINDLTDSAERMLNDRTIRDKEYSPYFKNEIKKAISEAKEKVEIEEDDDVSDQTKIPFRRVKRSLLNLLKNQLEKQ